LVIVSVSVIVLKISLSFFYKTLLFFKKTFFIDNIQQKRFIFASDMIQILNKKQNQILTKNKKT